MRLAKIITVVRKRNGFGDWFLFAHYEYGNKKLWQDMCQCDTIVLVRLEQCRDSLVVVFPETERKVHMNTLEILTLLLVVFAAMSYTDNHRKK